jgi:hypothetical protein
VQPHSFVSVGIVALAVALADVGVRVLRARGIKTLSPDDWASVWCWLAYGVVALALASLQLSSFLHRVSGSGGFMRVQAIWSHSSSFVTLWYRALGLFVPLFAVAAAVVLTSAPNTSRLFFLGFSAVFASANIIIFQPWEMDNTKVRADAPVTVTGRLGVARRSFSCHVRAGVLRVDVRRVCVRRRPPRSVAAPLQAGGQGHCARHRPHACRVRCVWLPHLAVCRCGLLCCS